MTVFLPGICPICTEYLKQEGDRLQCPAGDYETSATRFESRWQRYISDTENPPTGFDPLAAAEELLEDLQRMNQIRRMKNEKE